MLAQILQEMWVDPEVLEALSEDQKRILFLKMREEQVRRWKEREEKDERERRSREHARSKKGHSKSVRWLLGRDGDVSVSVIGEEDSDGSKDSEEDQYTGSAEVDPKDTREDSIDSVSGYSTDDLKDWGLCYRPHCNNISLCLQPQLSAREKACPQSRRVVVSHEEESPAFGGRVAQLRRAFATSSPTAMPRVATKPFHL
ncbi:SH2 domain-containing protein 4A isoform X2 [Oncorhynchus tshawytscha]|uniref:SH2 domain-containing protein 4A isoform X2 n=1 Tax=Oncorhynchus tshawytscha TaxID=74940 RepID=UPI001C3E4B5C|nr:SH2 domain-containing protein 4A isoform X2 [Oncorhynchus tshawytscha]